MKHDDLWTALRAEQDRLSPSEYWHGVAAAWQATAEIWEAAVTTRNPNVGRA